VRTTESQDYLSVLWRQLRVMDADSTTKEVNQVVKLGIFILDSQAAILTMNHFEIANSLFKVRLTDLPGLNKCESSADVFVIKLPTPSTPSALLLRTLFLLLPCHLLVHQLSALLLVSLDLFLLLADFLLVLFPVLLRISISRQATGKLPPLAREN
jgi:hypothetical protein